MVCCFENLCCGPRTCTLQGLRVRKLSILFTDSTIPVIRAIAPKPSWPTSRSLLTSCLPASPTEAGYRKGYRIGYSVFLRRHRGSVDGGGMQARGPKDKQEFAYPCTCHLPAALSRGMARAWLWMIEAAWRRYMSRSKAIRGPLAMPNGMCLHSPHVGSSTTYCNNAFLRKGVEGEMGRMQRIRRCGRPPSGLVAVVGTVRMSLHFFASFLPLQLRSRCRGNASNLHVDTGLTASLHHCITASVPLPTIRSRLSFCLTPHLALRGWKH
jgi:hypothetical protein